MFKVVPDQLRVSEGWVRCGQCDEVFDANAHLQTPASTLAVASASAPSPDGVTDADASNAEGGASGDYDWGQVAGVYPDPASKNSPTSEASAAANVAADPEPDPVAADPAPETPHDDSRALGLAEEDPLDATPAPDPFLEKSPQELSAFLDPVPTGSDLSRDAATPLDVDQAAHAPAPSFLAREPVVSRRVSRVWSAFMALACIVLSLALGVQYLLHERDRIVVKQPALAPLVVALCGAVGCRVEAFRDIDSLVIDSSSFAKANAQSYKLQFTLKNVGNVTVATPALELTLTDTQDHTVVRRVVRANEFGNRQRTLGPGDEVTTTLPIQVKLANGSEKIAGYRLLAFYP